MNVKSALVTCHAERPLDDEAWRRLHAVLRARPGGFTIVPLLRPPDAAAGEDEQTWLARARVAAALGPIGLHTHWTSPEHARPSGSDQILRLPIRASSAEKWRSKIRYQYAGLGTIVPILACNKAGSYRSRTGPKEADEGAAQCGWETRITKGPTSR